MDVGLTSHKSLMSSSLIWDPLMIMYTGLDVPHVARKDMAK